MKIRGSNRADVLDGTSESDVIYGLAGDDRILANSGDFIFSKTAEKILAGAGDDTILDFAIHLKDPKQSFSTGSVIDGGTGFDTVVVDIQESGDAKVVFNAAVLAKNITLKHVEQVYYTYKSALQMESHVKGTKANEVFDFTAGINNHIDGGAGNDLILAGGSHNELKGGAGSDILVGRGELTGGLGKDYFVFTASPFKSKDIVVTDFRRGADKILIDQSIWEGSISLYSWTHEGRGEDGRGETGSVSDFHKDKEAFAQIKLEKATGALLFHGVEIAILDGVKSLGINDVLFY
ncbi:M10 family metallopeptidase C-terminal domain-containing protein [Ensifer soli]|uniref:M10 family metallopeptidase C-terminal domain-containing protein n=1 Tax=Ciceribacter sp. sgz301302 TaxID=3342379 RepID=UPI0035B9C0C1